MVSFFTEFSKIHRENLKKLANFFKLLLIHIHPSHPHPNIINSSFCALEGLLLTKLNHYFNDAIEKIHVLAIRRLTLMVGWLHL